MSEPANPCAILFVDDEELSRKYFRRFFGRAREVLTAADGCEGLKVFRANQERIGVIVTDQMMPEMTGLELLQEIEATGSSVVRVLSTAYADTAEVEAATGSGLVEFFITKPWDLPELEALIERAESQWRSRISSAA